MRYGRAYDHCGDALLLLIKADVSYGATEHPKDSLIAKASLIKARKKKGICGGRQCIPDRKIMSIFCPTWRGSGYTLEFVPVKQKYCKTMIN